MTRMILVSAVADSTTQRAKYGISSWIGHDGSRGCCHQAGQVMVALSPTLHRPCLASVPSSMYIFAHIASFPPLITCNERFVIRIATLWICIAFDTVKTKHCCSCLQPKYISTSVMSTHSTAMSTSHCSEVNLCSIVLLMCTKSSTAA